MAIVTLISDMGDSGFYVPAIKGVILTQSPDMTIVDISHQINSFDLAQTAYILKNTWYNFPKGTAHIIAVDTNPSLDTKQICVRYQDHYFIGADNGVFSLIFDSKPEDVFELKIQQDSDIFTFPSKNIFAKAAAYLAAGGTPELIGRKTDEHLKTIDDFRPITEDNSIVARIIFVDNYGNVITNLTKGIFNAVAKGRDFIISFNKADLDIRKISKQYNDVSEAKSVAFFNTSGNLEIALNKATNTNGGGASQLFGLSVGKSINIKFNDN